MLQNTDRQPTDSALFQASGNGWQDAAGALFTPMTNDYLFRALLQRNNYVLKGLVCALLRIPFKEVISARITNPILLGESIDDKTFFLDVSVILNDRTYINIEMQVINEHNWPERSLSYLCRTYDNLNSGRDYIQVKPAVQIGLLDFTLFPEYPEFYATYQFLNRKTRKAYSDKMRLSVLNLTRIDLATDEDRLYHLDKWAAFFKAATWEELKMLAKQDEFINEAAATIYEVSREENIRLQCEAREDYYRRQRSVQMQMESQESLLNEQKAALKGWEDKYASLVSKYGSLENENSSLQEELIFLKEQIESLRSLNDKDTHKSIP